ncbi:hypothetical protein [Enterobacter roggenkampii]
MLSSKTTGTDGEMTISVTGDDKLAKRNWLQLHHKNGRTDG